MIHVHKVDDVKPESVTNTDFANFLAWTGQRLREGRVKLGHMQWSGNEFFVLALARIEVLEPSEFEGEEGEMQWTTYTLGENASQLYDSMIKQSYEIVMEREDGEDISISSEEVENLDLAIMDEYFRDLVDWMIQTGRYLVPTTPEWEQEWERVQNNLISIFKGTYDPQNNAQRRRDNRE